MPIGKKRKHENFATGDVINTENGVFFTSQHKNKKIMEDTNLLTNIDNSIRKHIQQTHQSVKKNVPSGTNTKIEDKINLKEKFHEKSLKTKQELKTIINVLPKLPSVGQGSNALEHPVVQNFEGKHF